MGEESALSKTIIVKFSLTRNRALGAMVVGLLCMLAVNLGCEQLTLTTYYPAPYGVYSKMRVTKYIESGATGYEIRIGDISGLTGVANDAGIFAKAGSPRTLTMGASQDIIMVPATDVRLAPGNNANLVPGNDANLVPGNDLLLAPGGDLVLGAGIYFKDMCQWVTYTTGSGNETPCPGGSSVFMAANAQNQSSTVFIDDNDGNTRAVFFMSKAGSMLCCKLETQ